MTTTRQIIDRIDTAKIVNLTESHGECTIEVKKEHLKESLSFFKNEGYRVLMDLTAVDYLQPKMYTKIIYWLHNPDNYQRVRVIILLARNEPIPSVIDIYEGANWYERELYDMFGVNFQHHPNLTRILMPDDWVGHPMLRDYPLTEVPVQFKHGVMPKVPSEIIPNVKLRVIHD